MKDWFRVEIYKKEGWSLIRGTGEIYLKWGNAMELVRTLQLTVLEWRLLSRKEMTLYLFAGMVFASSVRQIMYEATSPRDIVHYTPRALYLTGPTINIVLGSCEYPLDPKDKSSVLSCIYIYMRSPLYIVVSYLVILFYTPIWLDSISVLIVLTRHLGAAKFKVSKWQKKVSV